MVVVTAGTPEPRDEGDEAVIYDEAVTPAMLEAWPCYKPSHAALLAEREAAHNVIEAARQHPTCYATADTTGREGTAYCAVCHALSAFDAARTGHRMRAAKQFLARRRLRGRIKQYGYQPWEFRFARLFPNRYDIRRRLGG